MCGIAGFFSYSADATPLSRPLLAAMTRVLAHRGPDGEGIHYENRFGLGHRRLAIIDPSPAGAQPMFDAEKTCVVTYNGEIYNYRELRRELVALGFCFVSQSDTEVLLNAYRAWGTTFPNRLNGIFAFALYDFRDRSLLLARDPIGVKPLFFCDDGNTVTFASEIKALLLNPDLDRRIDETAIDRYFCFNYTPAPSTGLTDVRQLEPGFCRHWTASGSTELRFRRLDGEEDLSGLTEADARAMLDDQLTAAIRRQTVSDVPIGSFLSGGLDSAAIAYGLGQDRDARLNLYHGRFRHQAYDESGSARQIAERLNLPLVEFDVEGDVDALPQIVSRHLEEPTADASSIPFYLLSKATAERVKVVLSGDGADELLAGYATYQATLLASFLSRMHATVLLGGLRLASRLLPVRDTRYSLRDTVRRFATFGVDPFPRHHCSWRRIFSPDARRRIYVPQYLERLGSEDPIVAYSAVLGDGPACPDRLAQALWMDLKFYLPNDMLVKVDRMSMAHGLEVRVPFLDLELVSKLISLPSKFKLRGGFQRKYILRRVLESVFPREILRRPKVGFNMPLEVYLRTSWGDLLMDVVASTKDELGQYLSPKIVSTLLSQHREGKADHRYELFGVLMFGLWLYNMKHEWKQIRHTA